MNIRKITFGLASALALVACGASDTGSTSGNTADTAPEATAATGETGATSSEIRIVGSSTVYPFSTKVAQEFKNKTGYNVVVESTGSGGGHKLFCAGTGDGTPDVTNSSRRQKSSELELCGANGVDEVVEVQIGFDGIVLANAIDADPVERHGLHLAGQSVQYMGRYPRRIASYHHRSLRPSPDLGYTRCICRDCYGRRRQRGGLSRRAARQ